jgi:hypothetical protein
MDYCLDDAVLILRRTPAALRDLLRDLPDAWLRANEGPGTWSPADVVGHLIHGERTDWIPRVEHILQYGEGVVFPPFDREAMFTESSGKPVGDLLETFARLREESLARLAGFGLSDGDLAKRGTHPEFGSVTLRHHLATWVAHDLSHVGQVVRTMAHQYADAVGPWRAYLSILRER